MSRIQSVCLATQLLFISSLLCASITAVGAPTARLEISRASGPAPLAVFFDASGTTDSNNSRDTFRQLGYRFNFGDPNSGQWAFSGASKNEQVGGPMAAHVFERAGTYTVSLTVQDADGVRSTQTATITVQPPNSAFSGTNTVCISVTADTTGCPSGAQLMTSATAWPTFTSNRRYLLRAGQNFSALGVIALGQVKSVHIGSFGVGAKPVVGRISLQVISPRTSDWIEDVVIMDLDALDISHQTVGLNLLFLRNSLTRGGMIQVATAFDYYIQISSLPGWRHPNGIFVVENKIDRNYDTTVNSSVNGHTGQGTRYAVMGNEIDRTREHQLRIWQVNRAFIGHNRFYGRSSDNGRLTIKLHSRGLDAYTDTFSGGTSPRTRSSKIVVADNVLGSSTSNINWLSAFGPQNADEAEGVEDVIVERNKYSFGTNYYRDIVFSGRRMTERANINLNRNTTAVVQTFSSGYNLPADWYGPYFIGQPGVVVDGSDGDSNSATVPPSPPALSAE